MRLRLGRETGIRRRTPRPPVGRRGREQRRCSPRGPGAERADSDGWGGRMRAAVPPDRRAARAQPRRAAAHPAPQARNRCPRRPRSREETEAPQRAARRPGRIRPGRAGNGGKRREAAARGQLRGGERREPRSPWRTALREGDEASKWPARQFSGAARSPRASSRGCVHHRARVLRRPFPARAEQRPGNAHPSCHLVGKRGRASPHP